MLRKVLELDRPSDGLHPIAGLTTAIALEVRPSMANASIKLIPLGKSDRFAVVDEDDFVAVIRFKWRLGQLGYARSQYASAKYTCIDS
jgi:hypothetical protein